MAKKKDTSPSTAAILRSFRDRIVNLENEKKELSSDIKDFYAEAKSQGFDVKALRRVVKDTMMDHTQRAAQRETETIAEGMNARLGTGLPFKPGHHDDIEVFLDETMLLQPLRWRRPRMIFVCSMTDLFADFVTDEMIDRVFAVMALCPQHTFQVLTKRPARMRVYLSDPATPGRIARRCVDLWLAKIVEPNDDWPVDSVGPIDMPDDLVMRFWPLPNVWLGTSCENQAAADDRVPDLLATPAAVRFVSAEPLLGPIDWTRLRCPNSCLPPHYCNRCYPDGRRPTGTYDALCNGELDWVIVGGESGPRARPMHPQWARDIRDQCAAAGVSFHFKQWGRFRPYADDRADCVWLDPDGHFYGGPTTWPPLADEIRVPMVRVSDTGRLLDGVEHNGFPSIPAPRRAPSSPSATTGALP